MPICATNVYTLVLSKGLVIYPVFCTGGGENQRPESGLFMQIAKGAGVKAKGV